MTYSLKQNLLKTGLLIIEADIYSNSVKLMLDTGSTVNVLDSRLQAFFQKNYPETFHEPQQLETFYSTEEGMVATIPFKFTDHQYNEPFNSPTCLPQP
jgi:hypothetical protein